MSSEPLCSSADLWTKLVCILLLERLERDPAQHGPRGKEMHASLPHQAREKCDLVKGRLVQDFHADIGNLYPRWSISEGLPAPEAGEIPKQFFMTTSSEMSDFRTKGQVVRRSAALK